jgi:hypothetical protein
MLVGNAVFPCPYTNPTKVHSSISMRNTSLTGHRDYRKESVAVQLESAIAKPWPDWTIKVACQAVSWYNL